jgi:hypothetical protein
MRLREAMSIRGAQSSGALDHDKYAKVGEADNFLLKFRKVGGQSKFHAAQL